MVEWKLTHQFSLLPYKMIYCILEGLLVVLTFWQTGMQNFAFGQVRSSLLNILSWPEFWSKKQLTSNDFFIFIFRLKLQNCFYSECHVAGQCNLEIMLSSILRECHDFSVRKHDPICFRDYHLMEWFYFWGFRFHMKK